MLTWNLNQLLEPRGPEDDERARVQRISWPRLDQQRINLPWQSHGRSIQTPGQLEMPPCICLIYVIGSNKLSAGDARGTISL